MKDNRNNKLAGFVGTIVFHSLLFLLFWLIVFKTPIPPFPEEGGSGYEVNFGTDETGSGDIQPQEDAGNNAAEDETDKITEPTHSTKISTTSSAEKILTDETNNDKNSEVATGKSVERTPIKESVKEVEKPVVEERKADSRFAYKKKKGNALVANEGETGGKGDQGSLDGSRDTKYHGSGGSGGMGDGSGKGTGTGDGIGKGSGNRGGAGISFSLAGRKASSLPIPKASFNEEGRVVVEIKVDQNGQVVSAKPGAKGSTTTNPLLMEIARKAAMSASFNTNHDAPDVQKGTIIYNFFLK